jgi:hypothetical protein
MTHNFHQSAHALFAARTKRRHDPMVADAGCECFIRNLELARINTKTGQRSRRSQTAQCTLKCLLSAKCFDRYISAASG